MPLAVRHGRELGAALQRVRCVRVAHPVRRCSLELLDQKRVRIGQTIAHGGEELLLDNP